MFFRDINSFTFFLLPFPYSHYIQIWVSWFLPICILFWNTSWLSVFSFSLWHYLQMSVCVLSPACIPLWMAPMESTWLFVLFHYSSFSLFSSQTCVSLISRLHIPQEYLLAYNYCVVSFCSQPWVDIPWPMCLFLGFQLIHSYCLACASPL